MKETTTKFGTTKKVDNHILACAYVLFALPFLYVLLFWIDLPVLDVIFLKLLGFKAVLQIMALILIVSSFSKGDVSLVSPMMAFTPLFMLFFTGRIMSDESITLSGQIGVILIVAGFYKTVKEISSK
jgi:drug/metabolite transporter (DMT)-like permease